MLLLFDMDQLMAFVVLRQICFLFNFNLVEIWSFGANSTVGWRKPKEKPDAAAAGGGQRDGLLLVVPLGPSEVFH